MTRADPYDAVRHYHPDGGLLCTYLGRPPVLACPEDPAGAPSGLKWRASRYGWRLYRGLECLGVLLPDANQSPTFPQWSATLLDVDIWYRVHHGTLADCARVLVEEVRRG